LLKTVASQANDLRSNRGWGIMQEYEYMSIEALEDQRAITDERLNNLAKNGWVVLSVSWIGAYMVAALLQRIKQ
jgi:hypothetical protein